MKKERIYKFVDLFAGCGGLSLGLQQAGFTPWFVNEIVEQFAGTYKANHNLSDDHYFIGDIATLNENIGDYKNILKDITLVCGGPPCQGFSMANRQRILDDPRNSLYKEYLKFLSVVRPQFFIMENVKGMMKKIDEIIQNFKEYLGVDYQYDYAVLKAQDFGVPQNRERFIMIGNRVGVDPHEIFDEIYKHKHEPFMLRDALVGLPHLESRKEKGAKDVENEESGFTARTFEYVRNEFYDFINDGRDIHQLYNHKNRYNNPRDVEIFGRLPQGCNSLHESIADIMPYKRRAGIFKDKYFKLNENAIYIPGKLGGLVQEKQPAYKRFQTITL
jgi:DNA (cytosine-5)-methyltransferase 1